MAFSKRFYLLPIVLLFIGNCGKDPVGLDDSQSVAADKRALQIIYAPGDNAGSVTRDVGLPDSGKYGSVITWVSNSNRIDSNGIVHLPPAGSGDTSVTLTATISKGIVIDAKEFVLTLRDSSNSHYEALKRKYLALGNTLKTEVETFRGKTFSRPVTIAVFMPEEYKRIITQTGGTISPASKKLYNDILKAEGLLHRNADYFGSRDSVLANETGGFYSDGSDSIYIILDENTPDLTYYDSITIFHEMVHALQDQSISLTAISNSAASSDQSYGFQYAIEGEAELFAIYYLYKLENGYYPSSSDPIMNYFGRIAVNIDRYLDSIHALGTPLLTKQPFYQAYYSYGPIFVNSVAGGNWSLIDANIYPRLPIKTCVALHPETFPTQYSLKFDRVASFIDSTQILHEVDELGEVLMKVLFREWDFTDFVQLSAGLRADNIIAYRTQASDSVRIGWYTYWQDEARSTAFFNAIARLINAKKAVTLKAATLQGDTSIVNDTVNRVYIEKNSDHVFVLEDYAPAQQRELIDRMRGVKWYVDGAAKTAVPSRRYSFIDKSKLVNGWRKGVVSPDGIAR